MNKIIKLVIQAVEYFLIALFVFWIFTKIGMKTDFSMITLAIGLTIGWAIYQVGKSIIIKRKHKWLAYVLTDALFTNKASQLLKLNNISKHRIIQNEVMCFYVILFLKCITLVKYCSTTGFIRMYILCWLPLQESHFHWIIF